MQTPYLSRLEHGSQTPTLDVVNRLARALGVTLAELFRPFDTAFRRRIRPRIGPSRKPRGRPPVKP